MDKSKLTELEEEIISQIEKSGKSLTYKQIKHALKINTEAKVCLLDNALKNLETNGYLYLNDYDKYQLFEKCSELAIGQVKCNSKKKVYVVVGKNNIFIPDSHLNGAIAGDIVVIRRSNYKIQGNSRGFVDKILKRETGELIFDYIDGDFIPYNWPYPVSITIPSKQLSKLVDGSRVVIRVSLEKTNNSYNGNIVSLVGHKDDPQLDIKTIVSKNGVIIDFSKEALEQTEQITTYVSEEEINERVSNGGLDLRNETIFTIDGECTKDIDDAVSVKKTKDGYILGVHIADVSHYIPEDSVLDLEARERSTSVYPYNCVIPMLPHKLSNGICSLFPNEDRLTLSCIMKIDFDGNITDYNIVDTVIRSKKKMCYKKINDIFEKGIIDPEYEPFLEDLTTMVELSSILSKKKIERGYLSFGDEDIKFKDENGTAVDVQRVNRGISERMIENFMLAANEATSSFYYWLGMPGIYRDHPVPDVASVREIIRLLGLKIHIPNNIDNPRVLQNIINRIQKFDEGNIYSELILQSMKRAYYSPNNIGHFGLALNTYTHFTSPIRRYPDLATHRILRKVRDNILDIDIEETYKILSEICKNSSSKERIADKAEKDANHYKVTEYMEQHIGEQFVGYIHYISKNGLTIKTDNLIFGKVSMESLKTDGWVYNDQNMTLYNKFHKTTLFIGDKVEITLKDASKETGKIEFIFDGIVEKEKKLAM